MPEADDVSSRTMFEPNISAIRAGIMTRPARPDPIAAAPVTSASLPASAADQSAFDAPIEPTQAIDLVVHAGGGAPERSGSHPARHELQGGVAPMGTFAPMAPHAPLPGIDPMFPTPPANGVAQPGRTSPWLYVFVALSIGCLVATVAVVALRG